MLHRSGTRICINMQSTLPLFAPSPTTFDLHLGDCVKGMRGLPDSSIAVVVTSPPYNLGIKYRSFADNGARSAHIAWCMEWGTEIRRLLKPEGSLFLNVGSSPTNPMFPFEIAMAFSSLFAMQNVFHWIKSVTIKSAQHGQISAGHFKPLNSKRFVNDCHEFVFHFTPTGNTPLDRLAIGVPYADKSNVARFAHTGGQDKRCRGNVWHIPYKTITSRDKDRPHPATFPVELAENCFRIHGNMEAAVGLDPFLGLGHAAVAARNCHLTRFIGFEIDPGYLDEAKATLGEGQ